MMEEKDAVSGSGEGWPVKVKRTQNAVVWWVINGPKAAWRPTIKPESPQAQLMHDSRHLHWHPGRRVNALLCQHITYCSMQHSRIRDRHCHICQPATNVSDFSLRISKCNARTAAQHGSLIANVASVIRLITNG